MSRSKQKVQKSRRKLLAAMSVGAAVKLPELWSKPTVASVMLPAHAAGSPPEGCTGAVLLPSINSVDSSFTFLLAGRGYDLPAGGDFFAGFTFAGDFYSLAAVSIAPGVHGATMAQSVTFSGAAFCGNPLGVTFYSQDGFGTPLCGTTINPCPITVTVM